jgi:sugar/nucleoside kinase (ribokinase family)
VEELAYMLDRELFEKRKVQANGRDPVLSYTGHDCTMLSGMLLDLGVKIAAIKLGINGYYLRTAGKGALENIATSVDGVSDWADRELWVPSYEADKFGSATGAGDATIAGFLAAFLRELNPIQCVKVANVLGWQNVREMDAISGIEDWECTLERVKDKNRQRNPLVINDAGWRYCDSEQVYYGPYDRHNK